MINRSLIRIKTVQILYSYLLTRSDFKLEAAPDAANATTDTKFAYSVYLDLIFLLLKLSGQPMGSRNGATPIDDPVFKKNRVAKSLRSEPSVQKLIAQTDGIAKFDAILPELANAVADTALYKEYSRKRKLRLADDVNFWTAIFSTVIRQSKSIERIFRHNENFSHLGFDKGMNMFIDTLNSFDDAKASYKRAKNELDDSLTMAYSLYHALLRLPVAITARHMENIEANKNKYRPTAEDLNPNMRLADNLFVKALSDCEPLNEYIKEHDQADPEMWYDGDLLIDNLLEAITASDLYQHYIETPEGDFATDAAFWRDAMRSVILPSDELTEALLNQSVYWNDDLSIMGTFVLKTIRRSYAGTDEDNEKETSCPARVVLLPKFIKEEDERFGAQLFEYTVENRNTYREYIDSFIDTKAWDTERLAFMDIILLMTAIAEIINFPTIPVPVTCNEYIEIANDYSTRRSGQFINGVLYSVIKMLNEKGIINK